jgi:hypothetical protein
MDDAGTAGEERLCETEARKTAEGRAREAEVELARLRAEFERFKKTGE